MGIKLFYKMIFKNKLIFFIIFLFSFSCLAQSKCYLMGIWTGKRKYLLYESLILNGDNTFIWTSLYDLKFTVCGTYQIKNDAIELLKFKSDTIVFCEEPEVIKNILNTDYKTEFFERYKIKNNQIYVLNKKEKIKHRIKDNSFRTNLFADLFGKTYFYKEIDCEEVSKMNE